MDPALFRWYAADMTQAEFFRVTPRTVFLYIGGLILGIYLVFRAAITPAVTLKN